MNNRANIDTDVPKYKKKSTTKGRPRSKHKHIYETVLLTTYMEFSDFKTGRPELRSHPLPTKVCTICGRIEDVDKSDVYYNKKPTNGIPFLSFTTELNENAFSLPKYKRNFYDKFAIKDEEEDK